MLKLKEDESLYGCENYLDLDNASTYAKIGKIPEVKLEDGKPYKLVFLPFLGKFLLNHQEFV